MTLNGKGDRHYAYLNEAWINLTGPSNPVAAKLGDVLNWDPDRKAWYYPSYLGFMTMSEINQKVEVRKVSWEDDGAFMGWYNPFYPNPVFVFEEC
ncbi:MAG: hypothetical protein WCJ81_02420 [bacterium]